MDPLEVERKPKSAGVFPATHWTEIAAIANPDNPDATVALENLCRIYLPAIEAHIRWLRNVPGEPHELANEFLAQFIHQDSLKRVDRTKGRFRNYIAGAIRNFLQVKRRHAAKTPLLVEWNEDHSENREPAQLDAEFDRRFAKILVGNALSKTIAHFKGSRIEPQIPILLPYLGTDPPAETLRDLAMRLGISEDLLYQHFRRFRNELFRQLRTETRRHLGPDDDVTEEMQALLRAYAKL